MNNSMKEGRQGTTRIDHVVGVASIVGGLVLILSAWQLGIGTWREPGPGAWPFLLSITLASLGGWLLFRADPSALAAVKAKPRWEYFVFALLSMFGYVLILMPLGYLVSTLLLLLVQFRFVEGRRWGNSFLAALLAAVVSFIVFGIWLKVSLPAGVIPIRTG